MSYPNCLCDGTGFVYNDKDLGPCTCQPSLSEIWAAEERQRRDADFTAEFGDVVASNSVTQ